MNPEFRIGDKVRPKTDEIGYGNYFTGVDVFDRPVVTVTGTSTGSNNNQIIYFEPQISRGELDSTGNAFSRRMELVERAPSEADDPAKINPFEVQEETVSESQDLTEFKAKLWKEAQDIKEDYGYESAIDRILTELGVQPPANSELEDYEIGTIVPVPRERQNFFVKTSGGWRIVWPAVPEWEDVRPGGGVEQILKNAIKEKEAQNV